jgi:hypothetical protein
MEYELTILDRWVLVQVFVRAPPVGSYLYHKEFNRVAGEISIPQEEQDEIEWEVVKETGGVKWNDAKAQVKTVDIPDCIEDMIVTELKKLDEQQLLEPPHIPVYEKFVLPYDERKTEDAED